MASAKTFETDTIRLPRIQRDIQALLSVEDKRESDTHRHSRDIRRLDRAFGNGAPDLVLGSPRQHVVFPVVPRNEDERRVPSRRAVGLLVACDQVLEPMVTGEKVLR